MNHEITSNRRHIVLGILAHVDAGKTTLSESLLYLSGVIRRQGRVDHGDAYLDTDSMERQRGITIFSKQAQLSLPDFGGLDITLLDTCSIRRGMRISHRKWSARFLSWTTRFWSSVPRMA